MFKKKFYFIIPLKFFSFVLTEKTEKQEQQFFWVLNVNVMLTTQQILDLCSQVLLYLFSSEIRH